MATYQMKVNPTIRPVQPDQQVRRNNETHKGTSSFGQVLNEQMQQKSGVVFSKHASERLLQRNIQLTPQEVSRINAGLEKAAQKGIKEALIMMGNRAFIASVNNRTVITAAVDEQLKDSVFTNIDGAVIV